MHDGGVLQGAEAGSRVFKVEFRRQSSQCFGAGCILAVHFLRPGIPDLVAYFVLCLLGLR